MTFPQYPEYKESGVDWLGEVPEHWEVSRLKFFGELATGITPPSEDLSNYSESGRPWVRPDDLDASGSPVQASKFLTDQGWSYCRPVSSGATLLCCIGSIGKLGYTATVTCTNQQITAVQPYRNSRYLFYLIYASKSELDSRATGNVLRILNAERLGNVPVVMPPSDEQAKIAVYLDHETARIDLLVTEQQRLIELLKEKRQAMISHAVTKGLDPDVPRKDSGLEWLGAIPEHWQVRRLKDCGSLVGGTGFPHAYQNQLNKCVAFYKVGDLGKSPDGVVMPAPAHTIDRTEATKLGAQIIPPGSIVWAKIGAALLLNRRRITSYPACLDNNMTAYVPDELYLSTNWAYYWTSQLDFSQFVQGGAVPSLSEGYQSTLPLILPSLEEQASITAAIDHEVDCIDSLIKEARAGIGLLHERRAAVISAAVTGEIDVRNWQAPAESETETETYSISAEPEAASEVSL